MRSFCSRTEFTLECTRISLCRATLHDLQQEKGLYSLYAVEVPCLHGYVLPSSLG